MSGIENVRERAGPSAHVFGREGETASLDAFVGGERFPGTLVVSGAPGTGKSTLWEAGVAAARGRGLRVLASRTSEAEAKLAFGPSIGVFKPGTAKATLTDTKVAFGARGPGGVSGPGGGLSTVAEAGPAQAIYP